MKPIIISQKLRNDIYDYFRTEEKQKAKTTEILSEMMSTAFNQGIQNDRIKEIKDK
jgi:hypothetical protein